MLLITPSVFAFIGNTSIYIPNSEFNGTIPVTLTLIYAFAISQFQPYLY